MWGIIEGISYRVGVCGEDIGNCERVDLMGKIEDINLRKTLLMRDISISRYADFGESETESQEEQRKLMELEV